MDDYYRSSYSTDGRQSWCRNCMKAHNRRPEICDRNKARAREHYAKTKGFHNLRRYGIGLEEYNALLEKQKGVCAICFRPNDIKDRRLAIDHDHRCCAGIGSCGGCIRGLLCTACNTALGAFKDSPNSLVSALEYLGATT